MSQVGQGPTGRLGGTMQLPGPCLLTGCRRGQVPARPAKQAGVMRRLKMQLVAEGCIVGLPDYACLVGHVGHRRSAEVAAQMCLARIA